MNRTTKTKRERPIIFSGDSVRAILEGRKTQARHVVKPQPQRELTWSWLHSFDCAYVPWPPPRVFFPWHAGDRLWVRETWANTVGLGGPMVSYRADGEEGHAWRSPIHMPRWASRLTLEITDVRAQQLRDMTSEDAVAEGFAAIDQFKLAWNRDNKKHQWDSNPWVWVLSFRPIRETATA